MRKSVRVWSADEVRPLMRLFRGGLDRTAHRHCIREEVARVGNEQDEARFDFSVSACETR